MRKFIREVCFVVYDDDDAASICDAYLFVIRFKKKMGGNDEYERSFCVFEWFDD